MFEDISGSKTEFVRLDNNKTIIKQDSILYIQKDNMKSIFYTDTREYETYSSFKTIMLQLPNSFVQCHKSYIVNIDKITGIDIPQNTILLSSTGQDKKCYIGPKYKNNFMEVLNHGNFSNNLVGNDYSK